MRKLILLLALVALPQLLRAQMTTYDSLLQIALRSTGLAQKEHFLLEAGLALVASQPMPVDSAATFKAHVQATFGKEKLPERMEAVLLLTDGEADRKSGRNLESFEKAKTAKEMFKKLDIRTGFKYANNQFISGLLALGRNEEAVRHLREALDWSLAARDTAQLSYIYLMLGRSLTASKQLDEAREYLNRALKITLPGAPRLANVHFALGNFYFQKLQCDSAGIHFEKSYHLFLERGDSTNAFGVASQMCNIEQQLRRYDKAQMWCEMTYAYFSRKADNYRLASIMTNLAVLEAAKGYPERALKMAADAAELASKTHNLDLITASYRNLALMASDQGKFELAFENALKWKEFADSARALASNDRIAEIEARYQTREQQATIAEQQLQLERQQSRQRNLIFAGALAFAALGAWFYRRRQRQAQRVRETRHALAIEHARAEQLAENDRLKSAFLTNISHEFRTPLTLILSPLRDLKKGTLRGDPQHYFAAMERNAQRLLQLINQLLDLAKLDGGHLALQAEAGDLAKFLRAIAFSFESLAEQKRIRYVVEVPSQPVFAYFDADKLEKIASNLLSNAFKFTPEGGDVGLFAEFGPGIAKIRVSDTGIGLTAEQREHIFKRFYQVETAQNTEQTGTGIGLALTKELVELHGGSISVESPDPVSGQGAVFEVALPLQMATAEDEAAAASAPVMPAIAKTGAAALVESPANEVSATDESPKLSRPTVLVVEDNADVRHYVADLLRRDFDILERDNGLSGLEAAFEHMPDLILSDIMMPEMDGLALLEKLKSDPRTSHVPVVLLTARAGLEDRLEGLQIGADAYLVKPFEARELDLIVTNLLLRQQVLREKFKQTFRLVPERTTALSADEKFILQIKTHIEENMSDEALNVETLASASAMSRTHLYRKLQSLTGKSPNALIREMRLERARQLLEQGAGNASEVAFRVGFSSLGYFSRCFAEHFGFPPSELRRNGAGTAHG